MELTFVFTILILIISIVLHEVAHGYAANWLGDPTARLAGRLTLNPLPHIDPLGSLLIPGILVLSGAQFLIGWAKPVPYNPYNLSNQKWGEAIVAGAGPATNIGLALIFTILIRSAELLGLSHTAVQLCAIVVFINILLAFFNMIPVPPLDGSKILKAILPWRGQVAYQKFELMMMQWGLLGVFAFIFIFFLFVAPFFFRGLDQLFVLLTGMHVGF